MYTNNKQYLTDPKRYSVQKLKPKGGGESGFIHSGERGYPGSAGPDRPFLQ